MPRYALCWLEYRPCDDRVYREAVINRIRTLWVQPGEDIVGSEIRDALSRLFHHTPQEGSTGGGGALYVGTSDQSPVAERISAAELGKLGDEGFILKEVGERDGSSSLVLTARTRRGLVYGVFSLVSMLQRGISLDGISLHEEPAFPLRIIDHWDNLDGTIERGYAGKSIFFHRNKVVKGLHRIRDYARLLASVGINGVVLNNVNVRNKALRLITEEYLPSVRRIADVFRDYGIRVYLSVNFMSPVYVGGLPSADPFDPSVKKWWAEVVARIYEYVPDFGGFLVKADSEFNPGPHSYGRSQADGANLLAEALAPHGGLLIWRAFVYNIQDWRDRKTDRARAAYDIFSPLDGRFADNVLLQIKNGPMDFQVREPVSPLFGGMERTNQMVEFQITQEYTGQQIDLCYLVPMWKEVLEFDTHARGEGSTVRRVVDGSLFGRPHGGCAGVANVGSDYNWTGHWLAQANLYGYGRLTWNPDLSSEEIAREWCLRTLTRDGEAVDRLVDMLLASWPVYEKYTTPLGLGWMVNPGHHYGPSPEGYEYSFWGTYHRADNHAIGVDRSSRGTGFATQYRSPWRELYDDPATCPEELVLFFHRLPYTYTLKDGRTLIQYYYDSHFEGVEEVKRLREEWLKLRKHISPRVFREVLERFDRQVKNAVEWRDVLNTYFYRKTGIPDEKGRTLY
ncbi:Glycosyl hydrolase 67 middle domain protein [Spirochaeta thermophila DSM 6578]|uniref:Xylan alpha-1,2-glucuronidase n=1 Tax=Winmispira thermophila (strain ATCC 700085 / DSM 6578 / Z-1203) TaxID=869211 RepID=G0GAH5_WINT7|nr:alpha-glucuronidase family glycosyl hydrolase [Spirochaeta thermophila]AEJ61794.1 Glycosyl hydrolase 67 middle domain protein [Spirochaeta thermophila DSM 6578]